MFKKTYLMFLLAFFMLGSAATIVGCNEGPLEETAEEVEDEIDDATDDN